MSRRRFMLQLGSFGVAAVWLLAVLPRSGPAPAGSAQNPPPSSTPAPTPSADASPTSSPGATSPPASGKLVGSLNQIRTNGGSLEYQDPKSGDPAVLVDLGGSQVVAFDAVCTHAGCTVQYQASDRQLICPCHGAVFDAAHDAQVLGGPAPTPLTKLRITVQPNGDVHAA